MLCVEGLTAKAGLPPAGGKKRLKLCGSGQQSADGKRLCEGRKGFLVEHVQVAFGDDLPCSLGVVGAEDEDALSSEEEAVEVDDAHPFLCECCDGVGGASRMVVELHGEDFVEAGAHACFLEYGAGELGLGGDDAADAVVHGVDDVGGDELDARALEQLQYLEECA